MPVNDPRDRVHNFFVQDNSLQGKHYPQVVEGNWPVLNSNIWGGSQGQVDQFNSNSKNYSSKNSDVDRGEASYSLDVTHGLNFITQTNLRPDLVKSQSRNEQPNGFMYGNQLHQTRQNEANFLGMDTDSDHLQSMTLRGMSAPEVSQAVVTGHLVKASDRSEISVSPVGFDFFGGQQQMSHQQPNITQSLLRQHSGINDMQQLQQQLMIRKMQEIRQQQQQQMQQQQQQQQMHQQQQIHQLDLRQQYLNNQVTSFTKQASGRQPTLVNGSSSSDTSPYPCTATFGNWLNQGSPSMQGSPNGVGFSPNLGQTQRFLDSVPQQTDQSLYGVPVSTSRGLNMSPYSQTVSDRASTPQMSSFSNFLQGNQPNLLPERVGVQDDTAVSRHNFQNENMFGLGSNQSLNSGLRNMGILQQGNYVSRNGPQQEAAQEKPSCQGASQNEVALDPTEEKILFGSDDNIWAAFGKVPQLGGETANVFDNDGPDDCLAVSIQSGSWSALMQSAVAETSSNEIAPQEEWSGLTFQNNSGPSGSQPPSYPNKSHTQEAYVLDGSKQTPSALSSLSLPLSNDLSPTDTMALYQHGQKFQNEPHKKIQTEMPQMFLQSLEETGKWSNCDPLKNSVAEGSQLYTDASQHPHQAERNAKTLGFLGQTGTRIKSDGWNARAAVQPKGDGVMNAHNTTNFLQNYRNSHLGDIQEEVIHRSSLWKSNSLPSSAVELGNGKSGADNALANHSIDNQDILLNRWKNAHSSARSQGGESLGRLLDQADNPNQVLDSMNSHEKDEVSRYESDSHNVKENSSDSHRSNLSQHTSCGLRDSGLSDATDSRPLSAGKQKLVNHLSRKVSAPRKFQYHPMGNVDEDVESAYGMKPPSLAQAMLQKNAHFGQAKVYGQVTRNSTLAGKGQSSELQRDSKSFNQDPSREDAPGHLSHRPRTIDTLNNGSSSSQNMLELFNKADQSRNHGGEMQFSSTNSVSQLPETEKFDDFVHLQHNQSYSSQGFGLQLGPPSQRPQISGHSLSSQSAQGAFNSLRSNNSVVEMGDRSHEMSVMHSVQSLPYSEETQVQFQHNISAIPEHEGNQNSSYKTPGTFTSASPGIPFSNSNDQNQQRLRVSGPMLSKHIDSFNGNAACSAQRTAEALQPVASGSLLLDKHDSFGSMSLQCGQNAVQRVPTATMATRDKEQTSEQFSMSGISQHEDSAQVLHSIYTNASTHQKHIGAKFQQVSQISELAQPNIVESSSPLMHVHENPCGAKVEEQSLKGSSCQQVASPNTDIVVPAVKKSLEKTSIMNHLDDSPTPSLWKNTQAFDGSVKPKDISHQSYSFLHNMHTSKDAESNLSRRVTEGMKGVGNVADSRTGSHNEHSAVVGDSLGSSTGVLSQEGNVASQDNLGLNQNASQNDSSIGYLSSHRVDHTQVSSQMVPSWLNQSGNNKNGQMLQHHDPSNITPLRPGESYTLGKCSSGLDMVNSEGKRTDAPVDTFLNSNSHHNFTPPLIGSEQLSFLKSSQLDATDQNLEILRPKKRKSATLDLHPWHKEISDVSLDHVTHRMVESEWDEVANCVHDKVEDDAELIEDGPPVLRSKRRLVLTTHLMQKLLHPVPTAILSADARASYDALIYAVSRVGLGDACSTVNQSSSSDATKNLLPRKGRSSARNDIRCNATVAEGLLARVGKLENDFSGLDKSASILDLRLECQDLEKFAVINRFARFHGRGQSDNAETALSNTSAMSQRPIPQRYVIALPLPRNIPDGAPCLSL